jgi:hypothetical protein
MKKPVAILVVTILTAVALRVGVALYLGNEIDAPPLLTDQRSYDALGQRLITGHGFSFAVGWYPFTLPDTPTAHWSFLYSLFVAAVYGLVGPQVLYARLAQAVLGGILLPWMVYRLNRRVFQSPAIQPKIAARNLHAEKLALIAAGISAIYFYLVLYSATLMTETFYIVSLLWSLEMAIALTQRITWPRVLAFGLSLGCATLLRQSILPWIAIVAIWLVWVGYQSGIVKRSIGALAASAVIIALMIAPFTLRNYREYGQFLLLNSNAGYAMYSAQHPMHGTNFEEFTGAPLPVGFLEQGKNEAQMDRELMQLGIGFVLADPGRYILLSASRIPDYFEFWPTSTTSLLNNFGRVGSFGLFLPFMLAGIWLALRLAGPKALGGWRKFSTTPFALLLLFMFVYTAMHVLTWAMPRYRLPVDVVAFSFAALALYTLFNLLVNRLRHQRTLKVAVE